MSSHSASLDRTRENGHPVYTHGNAEDNYIEGYEPSSLGASHSSLLVTTTWVGMGLVMASLVGFGTMIWAAGQSLVGTGTVDHNPSLFLIIGAIIGFGLLIVGFGLIFSGRKGYKEYVRRSGRTQ